MDDDPADPGSADDTGSAAGPPAPAVYANNFEVGYNAFEFVLDFGQRYDDSASGAAAARIVTAPAYAKVFCDLLRGSIVDYESNFGPIPSASRTEPGA